MADEPLEEERDPGPRAVCEGLADRGELLALLNHLEDEANATLLPTALPLINRCIRRRAQDHLSGLTEDLFARVLGLAALLLIKVQLYISTRLNECGDHGALTLSKLPADLIDEGWLDRAERLARFIGEVATTRSRIRHVDRLNVQHDSRNGFPGRSSAAATVAQSRTEAAAGEAPPHNGRVHQPAATLRLPERLDRPL